ncbi:MAG: helix-turn-helix domain-containing protein [Candidatus Poseidoniales archaeon]|jgi:DNA-binding HxlR family transcriptional regulator|nr:helix-turn-helix domain-containing protein [Candidatus Poseidoniales archaeon]
MTRERMTITNLDYKKIISVIDQVQDNGRDIRKIFQGYYNDEEGQMEWEVDAAVISFSMFSSRWTTEILSALYIAGDKRFNELRTLLRGISSRTLSDKLTACRKNGLVERVVDDGPPIRVMYRLTTHGRNCGRLLGPLVAYMKIHNDLVVSKD